MEKLRNFLKRKDIVFSAKRYFIDAMGAMAQGLFCTLLVGTILDTIGKQFGIGFLTTAFLTIKQGDAVLQYTIGGLCSLMVGPGMAVAIGRALQLPAAGAVFADSRRLRRELARRRGRPARGAVRGDLRLRAGQGRQQGDKDRHPRHADCDDPRGHRICQAHRGAASARQRAPWDRPSCGPRSCSRSSWASSSRSSSASR